MRSYLTTQIFFHFSFIVDSSYRAFIESNTLVFSALIEGKSVGDSGRMYSKRIVDGQKKNVFGGSTFLVPTIIAGMIDLPESNDSRNAPSWKR